MEKGIKGVGYKVRKMSGQSLGSYRGWLLTGQQMRLKVLIKRWLDENLKHLRNGI